MEYSPPETSGTPWFLTRNIPIHQYIFNRTLLNRIPVPSHPIASHPIPSLKSAPSPGRTRVPVLVRSPPRSPAPHYALCSALANDFLFFLLLRIFNERQSASMKSDLRFATQCPKFPHPCCLAEVRCVVLARSTWLSRLEHDSCS